MELEVGVGEEAERVRTRVDDLVVSLRAWRAASGNPSYAEIAARVARARRDAGVGDHEARVARSTIYDLFRLGRRRIDTELLIEVVRALGVDGDDLARWRACVDRFHRSDEDVTVPVHEPLVEAAAPASLAEATDPTRLVEAPEPASIVEEVEGTPRFPGGMALAPVVGRWAVALMLACVVVNLGGASLTGALPFLLYLDMVGTAVAAVVLGPWHGALVGVATNFAAVPIAGVESTYFAVVNVVGALVWGYGVRWGWARTTVRYVLLSCLAGLACTIVATAVILVAFDDGQSAHGSDSSVSQMLEAGTPLVVAVFSANLVGSVVDKVLSGLLALAAVDALASRQRRNPPSQVSGRRGASPRARRP